MMSHLFVVFPAIFFVVDPIGVLPMFVAMTARDSAEKCRAMARRAAFTAGGVMIFFTLFGTVVFKVFGVTLPAFRAAGGLLLMLTALDMLRAQRPATKTSEAETEEGVEREDIAVIPLAMPLLAGPGAIATSMVLVSDRGSGWEATAAVVISIVITMLITFLILIRAQHARRVLGKTGIAVLQRIFGLILAAIAVQFVVEGAKALWAAATPT